MTNRYLCIHGHFYQPPRENAWLEAIEYQESAWPYHDWNERITDECYEPNAHARILDVTGLIERIVNNYARISFNFGPTLLAWLQAREPEVYRAILEADGLAAQRFGGHGSALAQAYNHAILPLCNERDRRTQVIWGVRDFETRFGRKPEGMWLPETAADVASLEALAAAGIKFTILEPHQAARERKVGEKGWRELNGGYIDPKMPYLCRLPSGATIALFFYDGPISRAIAFEGLLDRGENLFGRLKWAFDDKRQHPQLVHIATDGESYGHHHRFGEMALAYALKLIEDDPSIKLTNYGQYLELHPPTHEVEIHERTAWSCAHGVGRWERDCGCNSGGKPGWNQQWRASLRKAFDKFRDAVAPVFEEATREWIGDPWAARDGYIEVILGRTPGRLERFFAEHGAGQADAAARTRLLEALEMQRHALLMYTSCGWFFDDVSGIETVQVMQYAARAAQLAGRLTGREFEQPLLDDLEKAESNLPDWGDGRRIWEKCIVPARVDLAKVAAHHGVSLLFKEYPKVVNTYCYTIECESVQELESGRSRLTMGHVKVTSDVVLESGEFSFAVLYFGGHNLTGGICKWQGEGHYQAMCNRLSRAFERADLPEVIRYLDHYFEASTYSLRSLFKDEQRWILDKTLESTVEETEQIYRDIHERTVPLIRFLDDLGVPTPRAFQAAAEFALGSMLRSELQRENLDLERIEQLLNDVREEHVKLDEAGLEYPLRRHIENLMRRLSYEPENLFLLRHCEAVVRLMRRFPFKVDLGKAQNRYYRIMENVYAGFLARANEGGLAESKQWIELFQSMGRELRVKVRSEGIRAGAAAPTPANS
jgi:alpha-amylase/alpha-mannosidase (GH57 family)